MEVENFGQGYTYSWNLTAHAHLSTDRADSAGGGLLQCGAFLSRLEEIGLMKTQDRHRTLSTVFCGSAASEERNHL